MKITDNRDTIKLKANKFIEYNKNKVYILGTNQYGLCTANWLISIGHEFAGFINDFEPLLIFENFNVLKSKDLPTNVSIINCIVEGRVTLAEENITRLNPALNIDYFALQLAFPEKLIKINFLDNTSSIQNNSSDYTKLYNKLADFQSKLTLENITNFRLNRDIKYLESFRFRIDEQYFESFIKLNDNPSFIDGGGFDGETSLKFSKLYPQYDRIFYFEPNEWALKKSKENIKHLENVYFDQRGLWNKSETLQFDNSLGSASKLSEEGKIKIETVAIDEIIKSKVDFMKLDIEGAEYNALTGAKNIIQTFKPVLAVCVYHNQNDFLSIPELIISYNRDYKIYLRHYTQGVYETVMYFV